MSSLNVLTLKSPIRNAYFFSFLIALIVFQDIIVTFLFCEWRIVNFPSNYTSIYVEIVLSTSTNTDSYCFFLEMLDHPSSILNTMCMYKPVPPLSSYSCEALFMGIPGFQVDRD